MNEAPFRHAGPTLFERRLTIVALSVLLVFLTYHLLRELASVLQPLFIAALVTYMAIPAQRWLVSKGVPSNLSHFVLIGLVLVFLFLVGQFALTNLEDLISRRAEYEQKLNRLLADVVTVLPFKELQGKQIRDLLPEPTVKQILDPLRSAVAVLSSFLGSLFVVILYLIFLAAEIISFPARAEEAFGPARASQVMDIVGSINRAIGDYLGVMTLINVSIGVLTFVVLVAFGVPFALLWGLLMFLFSYIPYIGSILVTLGILVLGLVEYADRPWIVATLAAILIGIQQFFGSYLQPRLMGTRLGVSPLLILLSLGFWGLVWGIVGMLLAVPLLMILKIALENVPETRPIAKLMSNP